MRYIRAIFLVAPIRKGTMVIRYNTSTSIDSVLSLSIFSDQSPSQTFFCMILTKKKLSQPAYSRNKFEYDSDLGFLKLNIRAIKRVCCGNHFFRKYSSVNTFCTSQILIAKKYLRMLIFTLTIRNQPAISHIMKETSAHLFTHFCSQSGTLKR